MSYKGDTGLFRKCLHSAGFLNAADGQIFNDNKKTGGRRLKLWFADAVVLAPLRQQQALWNKMLEVFGDRILKVEFIDGAPWYGIHKSLVVHLKD